ncbi:MAG: urea carboxylase [Acidobacteria bacterium]|nr:MAG: urea carboxylase [Acidobacteriota bacterium]
MTIADAGDSALLLELEPVIDPAVNARAIAIAAAIAADCVDGVRDVVPTYRSVAVHFDPLKTDVERLRERMSRAVQSLPAPREGSLIEVPVTYGGEDGPDLQEVAAFAGLTQDKVIDRHCAAEYRVFMLGFLPGFAYMGSVDERIAAPRKATPRTRIPAGSVGIAGSQTGIYPRQSPGGWQLIGRTSVQVFDPNREPASLFAAGDRVRFISEPRTPEPSNPRTPEPANPRTPGIRSVTVLKAGLLTTIQDEGRWGHQDRGVPVAGPMDRYAHRVANALAGNSPGAAALEATLLGPELRFEQTMQVGVAGADLGASIDGTALPINSARTCKAGSVLRFGERRSGTRAYIAFDGGIDVPAVLGSRATHVVSGLGGIDGRALKAGDVLALRESHEAPGKRRAALRVPNGGARLRAMRGPQDDYFDDAAFEVLERTRFTISPQSDRMGYRLRIPDPGSRIPTARAGSPGSMISDATFIGGLQIPPSGDPILLMADRQTTGGYPQIATVITADLPLAGQLAPGDWIEFTLCTRAEAIAALKELENGV